MCERIHETYHAVIRLCACRHPGLFIGYDRLLRLGEAFTFAFDTLSKSQQT
jgi:hypothetical protein